MNEKEKSENLIIDKHYNEAYDINLLTKINTAEGLKTSAGSYGDNPTNATEFENKMNAALEKVNLTDNIDFDIPMDTLKIIEQAEQIKSSRNSLKENIYFIIASILILSSFSFVFLVLSEKFIIYFELVLFSVMPWSLIPLTKYSLRG